MAGGGGVPQLFMTSFLVKYLAKETGTEAK